MEEMVTRKWATQYGKEQHKEGYLEGIKNGKELGRQMGINEVVKWYRRFIYTKRNGVGLFIPPGSYAAKLKEWGVE